MTELLGMGFLEGEARRALRFCSNDVGAAASFVLAQRQKEEVRPRHVRLRLEFHVLCSLSMVFGQCRATNWTA